MYDAIFQTQIGNLGIKMIGNKLQHIDFDVKLKKFCPKDKALSTVGKALDGYFNKTTTKFSLMLEPEGTEFQMRVWKALQRIPYGETRTYGDLASQLNSSARAVGNACRRNPIPVVIPCHRVVAKTGIGGFSGQTDGFQIDRKQYLLKLEETHVNAAGLKAKGQQ